LAVGPPGLGAAPTLNPIILGMIPRSLSQENLRENRFP
jgi:hypothetical protein